MTPQQCSLLPLPTSSTACISGEPRTIDPRGLSTLSRDDGPPIFKFRSNPAKPSLTVDASGDNLINIVRSKTYVLGTLPGPESNTIDMSANTSPVLSQANTNDPIDQTNAVPNDASQAPFGLGSDHGSMVAPITPTSGNRIPKTNSTVLIGGLGGLDDNPGFVDFSGLRTHDDEPVLQEQYADESHIPLDLNDFLTDEVLRYDSDIMDEGDFFPGEEDAVDTGDSDASDDDEDQEFDGPTHTPVSSSPIALPADIPRGSMSDSSINSDVITRSDMEICEAPDYVPNHYQKGSSMVSPRKRKMSAGFASSVEHGSPLKRRSARILT